MLPLTSAVAASFTAQLTFLEALLQSRVSTPFEL